jgi:predicted dehydrogenase
MLDPREAVTTICGTLAGADMNDGLRINGIRNNCPYIFKPDLDQKSGALYFDAKGSEKPAAIEAYQWINAVVNDTDALVKPEEAYTVTRILEGIYKSAESGDIYRF